MKKRFTPKYIKRSTDRPSGIGQTGAHGMSAKAAPPDAHRLGNLPQDWPRSGQSGQYTASIMGRMGDGSLAYYTDEDIEEFRAQDGPPGKAGNFKSDMKRVYIKKGGGKGMIGAAGIHESEEKNMQEKSLRELIREMILSELAESKKKLPADIAAYSAELMRASDGEDEEDEKEDRPDMDEFSGAGAVAGFSLPLGASNEPSTLKSRGDFSSRMFGGGPIRLNARILSRGKK